MRNFLMVVSSVLLSSVLSQAVEQEVYTFYGKSIGAVVLTLNSDSTGELKIRAEDGASLCEGSLDIRTIDLDGGISFKVSIQSAFKVIDNKGDLCAKFRVGDISELEAMYWMKLGKDLIVVSSQSYNKLIGESLRFYKR